MEINAIRMFNDGFMNKSFVYAGGEGKEKLGEHNGPQ